MPTQADLFDTIPDETPHTPAQPDKTQQGSGVHTIACTFSPSFWQEVVARMLASESTVPLTRQLIIVPDNSMILAYRAAWAAQARQAKRAYLMPTMMTLTDWAKLNGAEDWDAHDT